MESRDYDFLGTHDGYLPVGGLTIRRSNNTLGNFELELIGAIGGKPYGTARHFREK